MIKMAIIPARYAATRFPYKLMQMLGDKTVIRHTYDNTVATGLFDDVIVATDHKIIFDEITSNGGKAVMSKLLHQSGSDRIAEAVADIDVDVIVNVQGDEPFVQRQPLQELLRQFDDSSVQVASLMKLLTDEVAITDPNYVKVVVNNHNNALYFSRSAIPYNRDGHSGQPYFEHIGVYAYTKKILLAFTQWPAAALELSEKLEQLRYLANGVPIRMVTTATTTVKIDVPEDLQKAINFLKLYKQD